MHSPLSPLAGRIVCPAPTLPLSHFIVTKNKLVETGLQLAKTVKLRKNTVRRATVFVISLSVAIYVPLFQGNLVRQ